MYGEESLPKKLPDWIVTRSRIFATLAPEMRNAARSATTPREPARGTAARLVALVAGLATVALLVSLPCPAGADACALAPAAPIGAHCPLAAAGGETMKCCAKSESPRRSSPATPAGPSGQGAGQRLQLQALPLGAASPPALPAALPLTERSAPACFAAPAASAVPLYTLLSTLLT